jgi:ubiquinone/menaquinone biosynthesis C-methylase UbiE
MPTVSKDFKSKLRFTKRAENYRKYRPRYPKDLFAWLQEKLGPGAGKIAADIGSGTGIFTQHLLGHGYQVYAIEPNKEMRRMAEESLSSDPGFFSVQGEALATGLGDSTVDIVTSAQAFHWFGGKESAKEMRRILKKNGKVLIVWNMRDYENDPFQEEYEKLLSQYCREYKDVHHSRFGKKGLGELFSASKVLKMRFNNYQIFDLEGLLGRTEAAVTAPSRRMNSMVR